MSAMTDKLGIVDAPSYHTYKPNRNEPTARDILKRHKNNRCTRQLAIYADERGGRSGLKKLRCIVNCYEGMPSILDVFDDSGRKIRSARLKKDYTSRLPRKDARILARVKDDTPVVVERF